MTSNGVMITPTKFEAEADTIAPATFPFAIEVKATEDCTVDGTSVRNRIPKYMSFDMTAVSGRSAMPISG